MGLMTGEEPGAGGAASLAALAPRTKAELVAGAALRPGPCFVDVQGATVEIGAVQSKDGSCRLRGIGHLDEAKAAGLPAVAISDDADALYFTVLGESGGQVAFSGSKTQIADEDIGHNSTCLF